MQDLGAEQEEEEPGRSRLYQKETESMVEQEVVSDLSIRQALETLKPSERQVVSLKVLGELTFKEIADVMGIPMGTVTWKYQNAIKKLRRCGYE